MTARSLVVLSVAWFAVGLAGVIAAVLTYGWRPAPIAHPLVRRGLPRADELALARDTVAASRSEVMTQPQPIGFRCPKCGAERPNPEARHVPGEFRAIVEHAAPKFCAACRVELVTAPCG